MLMTLERLQASAGTGARVVSGEGTEGAEVSRPETSKYSRSSNRNNIIKTYNHSNINIYNIQHQHKKNSLKNDRDTYSNNSNSIGTYYNNNIKYNKPKTENFRINSSSGNSHGHSHSHSNTNSHNNNNNMASSDIYELQSQHSKSRLYTNNTTNEKDVNLPGIMSKSNTLEDKSQQQLRSSQGFQINNIDIKQGITLDKVLGNGFKKIDIFVNMKEFDNGEEFPNNNMNNAKYEQLSEFENMFTYDNFEILESENEEDPNIEIYDNDKMDNSRLNNHNKEARIVVIDNANNITNNNDNLEDIRDRINKKYKNRRKSTKFKKNSHRISDSKSPENLNQDEIKIVNLDNINLIDQQKNLQYLQQQHQHHQQQGPNSSNTNRNENSCHNQNKFESKSLSPKFIQDMRKSRFQNNNNGTTTSFLENTKINTTETNQYYGSKSNFFPGNVQVIDTNEENFRNSRAFKIKTDGFNVDEKMMRNPFSKVNKLNNIDDTSNKFRTTSQHNTDVLSDTSRKSFLEKTYNNSSVHHKYLKDNHNITEKLKQVEKNLIHKYAQKFNLNTNESQSIKSSNGEDKLPRLGQLTKKQLSNNVKDLDVNATLYRKKFIK